MAGRTFARNLALGTAMLATAACGSTATQTTTTPSPSVSSTFTGGDFTTTVPNGWSDQTQNQNVVASVSVDGTVLMLLVAPPTRANVLNEHIDVSTVSSPVPDDQLATYLDSVDQRGASNLSMPQTFALDGTDGLYITYSYTPTGGVAHRIQDMLVNRNGVTYEIVLNTATTDFAGQLPALDQVLSAWHWTS